MRKLIILVFIILVILVAAIYLLIPNTISIQQNAFVAASRDGLSRKLYDVNGWNKWWPGKIEKQSASQKSFIYHNSSFSVNELTMGSIVILSKNGPAATNTALNIINKNNDTTQLIWAGALPTSYNPFKRMQIYFAAKTLSDDMKSVLGKIDSFFSKTENIYDFTIREESVMDSFLISTFATTNHYPSTDFTYQLLDQLKKYIAAQGAKESGFPMLNVSTNDSISYLVRVAIPVDRILPSTGSVSFKQMPGGGNILVTDIKGGPTMINKALHQMEDYVRDYHRSAPAIPFLSLITDRRQEADTSKWLTKIYYPVM